MPEESSPMLVKKWLDRFLVVDFFLVLFGAILFVFSILLTSQGLNQPLILFQKLWIPIFTPAITLLIIAALINALINLLQTLGPRQD